MESVENLPSNTNIDNSCSTITSVKNFLHLNNVKIKDILKSISYKKSSSLDVIPCFLLFVIVGQILEPLTVFINHSLDTGYFPGQLKYAAVIPIHKKDDIATGIRKLTQLINKQKNNNYGKFIN